MAAKKQTIILVDENDRVTGYGEKEEAHTIREGKLGLHHRGLTILVYNSQGELLLQHRKHRVFDRVWDLAGSTHPLVVGGVEESYEQAARRCLAGEWRRLEGVKPRLTPYFVNYSAKDPADNGYCENEFCRLMAGLFDGEARHNPESAYGHRWVAFPSLVADVAAQPTRYAPWVIDLVRALAREKRPDEFRFLQPRA